MKKSLLLTFLLCFVSPDLYAKPFIPMNDSEGTLLILKKYRDIFEDKYGVELSNSTIRSDKTGEDLKAKIFIEALDDSKFSLDETLNAILDSGKTDFLSRTFYPNNTNELKYLFETTVNYLLTLNEDQIDDLDIEEETFEKLNFWSHYDEHVRLLDSYMISNNKEKGLESLKLFEKYNIADSLTIRQLLIKYFGLFGNEKDENAMAEIEQFLNVSSKNNYANLSSYDTSALISLYLYKKSHYPEYDITADNRSADSNILSIINAHHALYNPNSRILDTTVARDPFSMYVNLLYRRDFAKDAAEYDKFSKEISELEKLFTPNWEKEYVATKMLGSNSLSAVIFAYIAPKSEEIQNYITGKTPQQLEYTKKTDEYLALLNDLGKISFELKVTQDGKETGENRPIDLVSYNPSDNSIKALVLIDGNYEIFSGKVNLRPLASNFITISNSFSSVLRGNEIVLSLSDNGQFAPFTTRYSSIVANYNTAIDYDLAILIKEYIKGNKNALVEIDKQLTSPEKNNSLLVLASGLGSVELVKHALEKNSDVNTVALGDTPLIAASRTGKLEIIDLLLSNGADINKFNPIGHTPLLAAAINNQADAIKTLVDKGAKVDGVSSQEIKYSTSPIGMAAYRGNIEAAKTLLELGADVNQVSTSNETALLLAAYMNDFEMVKFLVENGADPTFRKNYSYITSFTKSKEIKDYIETERNIASENQNLAKNKKKLHSEFFKAVGDGDLQNVKRYLKLGLDINSKDFFYPPLAYAIQKKHTDIIEFLLNHKDITQKTKNSTLSIVAGSGTEEDILLLLQHGAQADSEATPPLDRAIFANKPKNIELLISKGFIPSKENQEIFNAVAFQDNKKLQELIENGADINARTESGRTPLMYAAHLANKELLDTLTNAGADIDAQTNDGSTAVIDLVQNNKSFLKSLELFINYYPNIMIKSNEGKSALDYLKALTRFKGDYPKALELLQEQAKKEIPPRIQPAPKVKEPVAEEIKEEVVTESSVQEENQETVKEETKEEIKETPKEEVKTEEKIQDARLVAPEGKKAGVGIILDYDKDSISLNSFVADKKNDSLLQVLAKHTSPLIALRVESIGGTAGSWKTKDVKTSAMGVLQLAQDGKIVNDQDAAFELDVTSPILLDIILQDNGALTDKKNRFRVTFFYKDGSRNYAVISQN